MSIKDKIKNAWKSHKAYNTASLVADKEGKAKLSEVSDGVSDEDKGITRRKLLQLGGGAGSMYIDSINL